MDRREQDMTTTFFLGLFLLLVAAVCGLINHITKWPSTDTIAGNNIGIIWYGCIVTGGFIAAASGGYLLVKGLLE